MNQIKSLEFYSGIGGMHYALKAIRDVQVLGAFDINTTANAIYKFNFPDSPLCQNNIQSITVAQLELYSADLWTMSPPCQPFTRKGHQLGVEDRRTDSFLVLLKNLSHMEHPPKYLFLENVVGFEDSSVYSYMKNSLKEMGYSLQEFIINPLQLGFPNSRPRYYMLATMNGSESTNGIRYEPPFSSSSVCPKLNDFMSLDAKDFYYKEDTERRKHLFLSVETLQKYAANMDLVSIDSQRSACFTKSYGTFHTGCGSYFCANSALVDDKNRLSADWKNEVKNGYEDLAFNIRKFTPKEMAKLMGFPEEFKQPVGVSDKQMYRTLGNSVNVLVVSRLLDYLLVN